jgi:hypothetical protein
MTVDGKIKLRYLKSRDLCTKIGGLILVSEFTTTYKVFNGAYSQSL